MSSEPLTKEPKSSEHKEAKLQESPLKPAVKQGVQQPIEKRPIMSEEQSAQNVSFSAIRNPVNPERVIIYRIAPGIQTLSYEQRAIHKGVSAPRWNKTPDPDTGIPSPILLAASHLVTLVYDDVVRSFL